MGIHQRVQTTPTIWLPTKGVKRAESLRMA